MVVVVMVAKSLVLPPMLIDVRVRVPVSHVHRMGERRLHRKSGESDDSEAHDADVFGAEICGCGRSAVNCLPLPEHELSSVA